MGDVKALRLQLPRHALGQAAQAELAHREGCRLRIALHARRGAGELDRAAAARQHQLRCLLADQKTAIAGDEQRLAHLLPVEAGKRAALAVARIVDHQVGHAVVGDRRVEQRIHGSAVDGVAYARRRAGLGDQPGQLAGVARRHRHRHALRRAQPRQRCAEARARADDERGFSGLGHACSLNRSVGR